MSRPKKINPELERLRAKLIVLQTLTKLSLIIEPAFEAAASADWIDPATLAELTARRAKLRAAMRVASDWSI